MYFVVQTAVSKTIDSLGTYYALICCRKYVKQSYF